VDPGNFATNIAGGAQFGYLLVWVIVAANLMAMLIQYLSAKLGIVTDRNLAENSASTIRAPSPGACGFKQSSSRCRRTSPSSSVRPWR
jgi:NRAMP (natural resistance-associated macrophage protein)-like metal ion transporter